MMKSFFNSSLALLLVLPAAVLADDGKVSPVVISNGGMTQGEGVPADWTEKYGDCEIARDTVVFKEGPASLRITVHGPEGQVFQNFNAEGGQKIHLHGWVKSEGQVKVNVAVQSFDDQWTRNDFKQLKYVQNDTDWSEFDATTELPSWASHFHMLLLAQGEGSAWLDEVRDAAADKVDPGRPTATEPAQGPAPKDKPSVAGWGYYKDYPKAWMTLHNNFLDRTRRGNVDVVFLGDSITQGWNSDLWKERYKPLNAVNYGIGGDSTRQVLWRIEQGELDGIKPKLVVLMIGTNNLYGDNNAGSDDEIAEGITACVNAIRTKQADAKILLVGLLPRENDYFCNRISTINQAISKLDDGKSVRFLDMTADFLDGPGKVKADLYKPDKLHPVKKGYQIWAEKMAPLFDEMVK